jgi:photosystem II stability/assembly factor-like uncharacterized protein
MHFRLLNHSGLVRYLPLLILFIVLLMPLSETPAAQAIEVIVEDPQLHPPYTTCPQTYWYPFDNDRGHSAYLTLNTNDPLHSTNHGEWHPVIPQAGYYRVEAYIAGHTPITWCTGGGRTIAHDTTDAHYSIYHAYGVSARSLSQYPLNNQWLDLGEYYFNVGDGGYVYLTDLNSEAEYSTTVSFSAMRFTFTRPSRPQIYMPLVHRTDPHGQPPPNAGVIHAQGFDACIVPTISQMQTWWSHSPYSFYGLYIGGIHLPSVCGGANAAWVSAVHQQGWSFIPTWVGLQAPCSGYLHKMSTDPTVSYQEGRQEAQSASAAAASLGLTNYGLGGTIIYYDLEPYGVPTPECRQPVAAFMNGWVERLHELGNLAGGYGSRNSYLSDWSTIPNVPEDVWPASWYANAYDPYASVFGISWLEGLWTNHQRIRQYAGDINNNWGGVSLTIDIDVADGVVALPPSGLLENPVVTSAPTIEDAGWLSAQQGWLVSGNHLYWTTTQGKSWLDISPAPVQLANFLSVGQELPGGQAWALSTQDQGQVNLYHSSNWGETWERLDLTLPSDDWWPLQLQFTSPTTGWVVMQKATSQAFDVGIMMKTSDGGLTWLISDLPTTGKITFTSPTEGWLLNAVTNDLFNSTDGGLTWQIAQPDDHPLSSKLPEGATLSGWQSKGLGWAVTSVGSCSGEKSTPNFTCQVNTTLLQTKDGGETWDAVQLPFGSPTK